MMAGRARGELGSGRTLAVGGLLALLLVGAGAWYFTRSEPEAEIAHSRGLGDYAFSDLNRIYVGRGASAQFARAPAVVDSSRVYAEIPDFQQIQRERLGSDGPKYHLLMTKASAQFLRAVEKAAQQAGKDVVAEVGTLRVVTPGAAQPSDLTAATISALR